MSYYKPGDCYKEDLSRTRDQVRTRGLSFGCETVFADDLTLQVDLDVAHEEFTRQVSLGDRFHVAFGALASMGIVSDYETLASKSGNTHVFVKLVEPLPALERIALQAMLGSDAKREALNYRRLKLNGDAMICLYRPMMRQLVSPKLVNDRQHKESCPCYLSFAANSACNCGVYQ